MMDRTIARRTKSESISNTPTAAPKNEPSVGLIKAPMSQQAPNEPDSVAAAEDVGLCLGHRFASIPPYPNQAVGAVVVSTPPGEPGANGADPRADESGGVDAALSTASDSVGQALPPAQRQRFEASLGVALGSVRVHTGAKAAVAASALDARAFAHGRDVYFADGLYAPDTPVGERLLAHEVAHTVQQASIDQPALPLAHNVSSPSDPAETEANIAADAMTEGRLATVATESGIGERPLMRQAISAAPDNSSAPAPPAAPSSDPTAASLPIKFTIDKDLPPKNAGPFKIKSSFKADVVARMSSVPSPGVSQTKAFGAVVAGDPNYKPPSQATKLEVGPKGGTGDSGPSVGGGIELKHELTENVLGMTPELKGASEFTSKGGKISVGGTLSTKIGDYKVSYKPIELTLIKYDLEKKDITFAAATTSVDVTVPVFDHVTESGLRFSVDMKPSLVAEVTPDYLVIAEWLSTTLGSETLVGIGSAIIPLAAALVIFAGAYYEISEGLEIGEATTATAKRVQNYAQSYANIMKGGMPTGGDGAKEGAAKAQDDLQMLGAKFPPSVIGDKAKEMGLYEKIVESVKPGFREATINAFKKRHNVRVALFGVPPSFIAILDAKLSHLGSPGSEMRVGMRDDDGGI